MTTIFLIRHGLTSTTGKRLTGWSPGVHLSPAGQAQADGLVGRLDHVRIDAMFCSPLERCRETAAPLERARGLKASVRKDVGEIRFGDWTNRTLATLSKTPLWRRVQFLPSGVRFPDGETFLEAQFRAVRALETIAAEHPKGRVAVVTHADVIKLVLAHLMGVHLDLFQRVAVDPASISVVTIGDGMPMIVKVNDTGNLDALRERTSEGKGR